MFIVDVIYTGSIEQIDEHLLTHRAWLDQYYQQGIFLCSGPRVPRTGGVIIAAKVTAPQLAAIVAEDPFAIAGVARHQISEFDAVKMHPLLKSFME